MKQLLHSIVSLLVLSLLFSCSEEKKKEKVFVRPVKYQVIGYLGGEKIRTFSGTAETDKIINLSFRNSGIITFYTLKLGKKVKKGELMGKLDNVQSRLSYEQSLTDQNSAESQMNTAKLSLNRVRLLFEKGSSSLSDFEAAKNAYKTAQESYQSAKRGVAIQQEQVRYGYLYAPEDGVISSVISEIDENIAAGQTIGTLNAGRDMEIELGIPESVINGIKEGMIVDVNFTSLDGEEFKAKVTEVAPSVDVNSATYPIRVTISNPTADIKSGMAANVTFDFSTRTVNTKTLVVATHAVGEDSKGNFVFLIEKDGENMIVKKQHITIGALSVEGFEVLSGLSVDQKIATAGLQTLIDGQRVKL